MRIYLSKNLRFLRNRDGVSQGIIAKKLGMSRGKYAKYEEGANEPDIYNLIVISRYYDIAIEVLLTKKLSKK